MSTARAELEAAQAKLKALEAWAVNDEQLELLAAQLERETQAWEERLDRGERKVLREDTTGTAARVTGFGFSLLFVTPIVAMVGGALARTVKHEVELSVVMLVAGLAVVSVGSWPRARRIIAHRLSGEWRLLRVARAQAASLRALAAPRAPGEGR